jgi:dolichol-phosphate mannosyltransferase
MQRDLQLKPLAVVIPMANERDSAVPLLRDVVAELAGFEPFKVFVVFDHSCTDGTVDLVRTFAARQPAVQVVWAPENRCVVDAYVRGYREALASGAEWILEFDAGYSHAPSDIPRFVSRMAEGYDCVFGSRFCEGGRFLEPSWRRYLTSRGGTVLTNLLIGTQLDDMTSGFQMFNRRSLELILAKGLRSRGPFFQTEIKVYSHALKVCELPISYRATRSGARRGAVADAFTVLLKLFSDRMRGRLALASD